MKLIYIVNARIPTEKAHGYQICKMCEEFFRAGAEVELWVPTRKNEISQDLFSFYDLERNFKIKKINSIDFLQLEAFLGRLSLVLQKIFFLIRLLFKKIDKKVLIYTRDPELAWFFSLKNRNVIYEAHVWPTVNVRFYKWLLKNVRSIVVISQGVKNLFFKHGFSENNILVAPDGVDLGKFNISCTKEEARKRLNIPLDKKLVVYTGHLYSWKGADILAKSVSLSPPNTEVYIIGGTKGEVKVFREKYQADNLHIIGHRSRQEMPFWLKAADVLMLPNKRGEDISEKYTSPLKLFEYMASQRPIVASNLPSLREILNEGNSILVESDNQEALALGIKKSLENQEFSDKVSAQAFKDVQQYSWEKRAKRIIQFIMSCS